MLCGTIKQYFPLMSYVGPKQFRCRCCASLSWWRHQMETFSALLAICAGNSPVTGEFPAQRPGTRSFDVSFDLRLNKRLGKQSGGWWFGTLSRPLWRQSNVKFLDFWCSRAIHHNSVIVIDALHCFRLDIFLGLELIWSPHDCLGELDFYKKAQIFNII